jgi:hypothetical protein
MSRGIETKAGNVLLVTYPQAVPDSPDLSDLTDLTVANADGQQSRFCVIARTDAVEWETRLGELEDSDWPEFDLVKAPDEEWVEVYVFATSAMDARAQVEAKASELDLPALAELGVQAAGPELGL